MNDGAGKSNSGAVIGGIAIATLAVLLLSKKVNAAGTASLSGVLTDNNTGLPIPGATVLLGSVITTTGVNGEYIFNNLAEGDYEITFRINNYETEGPMSVTLHSGINTLNEALTPVVVYAEFTGKVTDAATGSALSGVTVTVGSYSFTTGSDGIFDIISIPVGSYAVSFAKSGYVTVNL